jgi:microcystin-dependent protein
MTLYKWSQAASSDATADSTINWAEGQSPSSVNDSARAMMAATAKYRDDIAGAIVTSGTSTAYAVSSYQVFDTLAHFGGQMIAFTPHTTNAATVTLNVDSLGAKPLRTAPNTELLAGTIIQGTPYVATYNNSDGAFYLQGFFGNPYLIPLAAGMTYFATSTPNSSFAFPFGQAISRTTYSTLFAVLATNFGAGDGSTTFNLPDLRGRVPAGWDAMGGTAANRLTSASGFGGLFSAAGAETETLAASQIPSITSVNASQAITVASTISNIAHGNLTGWSNGGGITFDAFLADGQEGTGQVTSTGNNPISVTSNNTGGAAHVNVQPTMQVNYIMRII